MTFWTKKVLWYSECVPSTTAKPHGAWGPRIGSREIPEKVRTLKTEKWLVCGHFSGACDRFCGRVVYPLTFRIESVYRQKAETYPCRGVRSRANVHIRN